MPLYPSAQIIQREYSYPPSQSPPSNPQLNWSWPELDNSGNFAQEWFWNGTYWLSKQAFVTTGYTSLSATGSLSFGYEAYNYNLFLESFSARAKIVAPHSSTNYWDIVFRRSTLTDSTIPGTQFSSLGSAADTVLIFFASLNLHFSPVSTPILYFKAVFTKFGTPGSLIVTPAFTYRLARP